MGTCWDVVLRRVAYITAQGAKWARRLSTAWPGARRTRTARYASVMTATTARPLKVGIQLPEVEREVRWPEYVAMARAAEDAGFDTIWLGDHLLYRYEDGTTRGPWEVWTLLAAIAASTSRIKLGPLVAVKIP